MTGPRPPFSECPISFVALHAPRLPVKRQQGATLLTALIFLVTLAMIGANAAKMSSLEERMAGNSRSRDLAFQAAEATLTYVQNNLNKGINISAMTFPGPGLKNFDGCMPNSVDYWNGTGAPKCDTAAGSSTLEKYNWIGLKSDNQGTATARIPVITLNQVAQSPLYVVERYLDKAFTDPVTGTTKTLKKFRVTARAVGGDTDTVVILQAIFEYKV